jgi:hypothetical protein
MDLQNAILRAGIAVAACTGVAFGANVETPALSIKDAAASMGNGGINDRDLQGDHDGDDYEPTGPSAPLIWDNGAPDNLEGNPSQTQQVMGMQYDARVADDFILRSCRWHRIKEIRLTMAVTANTLEPSAFLEIYDDCNGLPGDVIYTYSPVEINILGPNSAFAGFNDVEFVFQTDLFLLGSLDGCDRLWLSPVGDTADGLYYWLTSNSTNTQHIQGRQGHFKSALDNYPNWTPIDELICCPSCSDYNFQLYGYICDILKDQSNFDLDGFESIKFPNNILFGARSIDNFQINPVKDADCSPVTEICRLEAWVATNCETDRGFAEIYLNDCEHPSGTPIVTLEDPIVEQVFDDSGDPLFYDGLPVYKYTWECTGVQLEKGKNYWLSVVNVGVGIDKRSVWLFREKLGECTDIWITEGKYKNGFIGVEDFTPVSDPALAGEERDFAFKIWTNEVVAGNGADVQPSTFHPADISKDRSVDVLDLNILLGNWGLSY